MAAKNIIGALVVGIPVFVLLGGAGLSLLGYGVAWAIESEFGVPREMAYGSTLDLLNLSSIAIIGWVEGLDVFYDSLRFRWLYVSLMIVGGVVTLMMLIFSASKGRVRGECGASQEKQGLVPSTVGKPVRRFGDWLVKEKYSFIPFFALSFAPWVSVFILALVAAIFSVVPAMGHQAAVRHLHEWVVSAEYCVPLINRDERMALKVERSASESLAKKESRVTTCVSLWREDSKILEGRHVTSTEKHIIIFNPSTGDVDVVPSEGVLVRSMGLPVNDFRKLVDK